MKPNKPDAFVPSESLLTFVKKSSPHKSILLPDGSRKRFQRTAIYKCICGNTKELTMPNVQLGATRSCGCLQKKSVNPRCTKHGYYQHPAYISYKCMMARCYNPNMINYKYYGGIGVKVCDEWKGHPKIFVEWAIKNGFRKGLQIDKDIKAKQMGIPPLLYSPEMCSIVTPLENSIVKRKPI